MHLLVVAALLIGLLAVALLLAQPSPAVVPVEEVLGGRLGAPAV
jgi:hypothetical protein